MIGPWLIVSRTDRSYSFRIVVDSPKPKLDWLAANRGIRWQETIVMSTKVPKLLYNLPL